MEDGIVCIKIADPTASALKLKGSFEVTDMHYISIPNWRAAKGLELDLYHQYVKNIPETLKRL